MRKFIVVALFVGIAVSGGTGTAAQANSVGNINQKPIADIDDLSRNQKLALFKAQEKRDAGDYAGAAAEVQRFLEKNPQDDNYLLRFTLASDLNRAERPDDALVEYQRCVELEPRFAQGWLNLGELAYQLGQYNIAAEALTSGFEMHEDKPPSVLHFAAVSHIMNQRSDKAIPLLEQLTSGENGVPKMEWFRALLLAYIDTSNLEAGDAAVNRLVKWHGDEPDAWYLAFQFYSGMGDYRQATVALTVTGYLRPLTDAERVQLGDLYNVIEVPARAAELYSTVFGDSASMAQVERLASAYLAARDTDAALNTLTAALARQPMGRLWSLLGDLYYMERDYEDSYHAFEQIEVADPAHPRAAMMLAYCAIEMGDYQKAMAHLEYAAGFPAQEEKANELLLRIKETQQP